MGSPFDQRSLRATTAQGFMWSIGQGFLVHVLSLVSFIVLSHLLTPADYGIAALATVLVRVISVIGTASLGAAIVQSRDLDELDLDTVFWLVTAAGTVLAAVLVLASWPLAAAFDEPELRPVLQLLATSFVFLGLGCVNAAILQRRLAFRALAKSILAGNVAATVVGIAFGIAGLGVYALVVQTLIAAVLITLVNAAQTGYRPGRAVSWTRFRRLFDYSRHVLGNVLLTLSNRGPDDFLVGGVLGTTALGFYSVAHRVLTIVSELFTESTKRVAFPVFSRLQGDTPRLGLAYASAVRMAAAAALPVFFFLLAAAPIVIPTVFGDHWEPSVGVLQVLCVYGPLHALVQFSTSLLESIGRVRLVFRVGLVGSALQVALFVAAVHQGIEWVAAAFVVRAYVMAPILFRAAARELSVPLASQVAGLLPVAASTGLMALAVYAVRLGLEDRLAGGPLLVLLVALGVLVYTATLRLLGPRVFAEAGAYLRAALSRAATVTG